LVAVEAASEDKDGAFCFALADSLAYLNRHGKLTDADRVVNSLAGAPHMNAKVQEINAHWINAQKRHDNKKRYQAKAEALKAKRDAKKAEKKAQEEKSKKEKGLAMARVRAAMNGQKADLSKEDFELLKSLSRRG
jgi:6-phosphofructokinase